MKTFKNFIYLFTIMLLVSIVSCNKNNDDDDDNGNPNDSTTSVYPSNEHWFFDFNGTIDGGEGYDVIKSSADGKIYICGAFLHVNDNWDMKNLARWVQSSNTWEQVPGIDYYHSNFIRCGVADSNGDIYFGGDFSEIGGVTAGKVGKFNVASGEWSNLRDIDYYNPEQQRGPIGGGVYAIAIIGDYVYIGGGTFTTDSVALRYIRRFNIVTKKWEAVGAGVNGRVRSFTTDDAGNLYVGGEFTEAGGNPANYIAKWDGNSWSSIGLGCDNYVLSLAYNKGKLYAGGSFKYVGSNIQSQGIAMWNGSAWQAMGMGVYASWGNTYSVYGIAIDSDDKVYIGGFFDRKYSNDDTLNHVGIFVNDKWEQLGDGLATTSSQGVMGMMADGKDVYFVGYFSKGNLEPNVKINTAIWNENKNYTKK